MRNGCFPFYCTYHRLYEDSRYLTLQRVVTVHRIIGFRLLSACVFAAKKMSNKGRQTSPELILHMACQSYLHSDELLLIQYVNQKHTKLHANHPNVRLDRISE